MHFIVSHTHLLFVKHCHFKKQTLSDSHPLSAAAFPSSSRKKFIKNQFLYRLKLPTSAAAPAGSSSSLLEPFPINLFHCSPIHSMILSTTIIMKKRAATMSITPATIENCCMASVVSCHSVRLLSLTPGWMSPAPPPMLSSLPQVPSDSQSITSP